MYSSTLTSVIRNYDKNNKNYLLLDSLKYILTL